MDGETRSCHNNYIDLHSQLACVHLCMHARAQTHHCIIAAMCVAKDLLVTFQVIIL